MARKPPPKPKTLIQARLARCRAAMKKHRITAYLLTNRVDQIYLTGFDGEDGAALLTARDVYLITDGRFEDTVNLQAPWAKPILRRSGLSEAVAQLGSRLRLRTLHFQPDHASVELHRALQRHCRPVNILPAPLVVNNLRLIKDRQELVLIKKAIAVAQQAFTQLRKRIRIGMTENEVAAILEYEMKRGGATEPSFRTIVAEGANAALPHAEPGKRVLKKNSMLLLDWGARCDYYCSDLTRVLFMGKIPPRLRRVYDIVLQAQHKAIAAIAPGLRVCDIDKVARDHIATAGYGQEFGHGLGHGIGLNIHENPRLKFGFRDKLAPGMVVTVEPGIYLPGVGGIRIEDDVLVTPRGHRVLSNLPKSLASAQFNHH